MPYLLDYEHNSFFIKLYTSLLLNTSHKPSVDKNALIFYQYVIGIVETAYCGLYVSFSSNLYINHQTVIQPIDLLYVQRLLLQHYI